jgi:hypothetical protein
MERRMSVNKRLSAIPIQSQVLDPLFPFRRIRTRIEEGVPDRTCFPRKTHGFQKTDVSLRIPRIIGIAKRQDCFRCPDIVDVVTQGSSGLLGSFPDCRLQARLEFSDLRQINRSGTTWAFDFPYAVEAPTVGLPLFHLVTLDLPSALFPDFADLLSPIDGGFGQRQIDPEAFYKIAKLLIRDAAEVEQFPIVRNRWLFCLGYILRSARS